MTTIWEERTLDTAEQGDALDPTYLRIEESTALLHAIFPNYPDLREKKAAPEIRAFLQNLRTDSSRSLAVGEGPFLDRLAEIYFQPGASKHSLYGRWGPGTRMLTLMLPFLIVVVGMIFSNFESTGPALVIVRVLNHSGGNRSGGKQAITLRTPQGVKWGYFNN